MTSKHKLCSGVACLHMLTAGLTGPQRVYILIQTQVTFTTLGGGAASCVQGGLRWMCWAGAHGSRTEALAEQRLRMLRAFRAAAAQLLDALLRHMLQGLHGPSLATVFAELQVCQSHGLCSLSMAQRG